MIARHHRSSLLVGGPGLALQIIGQVVRINDPVGTAGPGLLIIGSLMVIIAIGYAAMAKGRTAAWGLLGYLGLIIVALLPDRTKR